MAKKKTNIFKNVNTYLVIALVLVVGLGLYFTLSTPAPKEDKVEPVEVREIVVSLLGTDCEDCFNVSIAIEFLEQQSNINVTEIKELSMEESKDSVEKYNISRLPAILLTGDVEELTIPNFDSAEDALVFSSAPPPYYDVEKEKMVGRVEVTLIGDATCTKCFNMSMVLDQLKASGVKLVSEETIDVSSDEAKELIAKYNIEKVPTMVFNSEALEYELISQVWESVGSTEDDGTLVLRQVSPPYRNLTSGEIAGLVELSMIVDESCDECYNVSVFKTLLQNSLGLNFGKEETYDVGSTRGKFLIEKHDVELVPTVVLSSGANVYPNFAQAWTQVGTVEDDGSYVFRNLEMLENFLKQAGQSGGYKNITSGEMLGLVAEEPEEAETVEEPEETEVAEEPTEEESSDTEETEQ